MYHINRCLSCGLGQIQETVHGFCLSLGRTADRVILRLGVALFHKLVTPVVDNTVILTVGCNEDAIFPGLGQDLHQFTVTKAITIGHIYLKAGDSLFLCNLSHLFQNLRVHMLEHTVKTIIYHGISIRQPVIFLNLVPQAAILRSKGHMIHNGGSAAAGSRNSSGVKIVNDAGNAHIQIHVGVDIHSARQNILSFRLYHFSLSVGQSGSDLTDYATFD